MGVWHRIGAHKAALREERARRLEEEATRLREQAAGERDLSRREELATQAQATDQAAGAQREAAEEAAKKAVVAVGAAGEKLEKALARAALEAAEAARDVTGALEACRVWGLEPGRPHAGVSGREVLAVAERLAGSKRLREIVRLAGRFSRIVLQKRRSRLKQEPTELSAIEIGGDISRVLPSELVALADDSVRRLDFCRRLQERQLLQYSLVGRPPLGRGALVVCVDESGSMAGNEIWAKAVALAMFNLAARENRSYALIHFGAPGEIRVDRFVQPRRAEPSWILEAVEHFFGGGTDSQGPLQEALKLMEETAFKHGDIVFITDANCRVSDEFAKKFNSLKREKELLS